MNRQTGNDIDAVRDATDLIQLIGEHVVLKQRGREHVGLCPFHDDHKPSFAVVTHKGNAFYKCHSCGAAGDAYNFVMGYHKMDFPGALRYLAERAGITLQKRGDFAQRNDGSDGASDSRGDLLKASAAAMEFFRRTLVSPAGAAARQAITKRGMTEQIVSDFALGAAPDQWDALSNWGGTKNAPSIKNLLAAGLLKPRQEGSGYYDTFRNRWIFPICDDLGRPIAFGGRVLNAEDQPKYLNSPESALFSKSKTLYGLHLAKRAIIASKQAIVTEGYTDVIACHQAGITNVVATLGTALTREHAQMLSRLCDSVVLIFDGDEAGIKAADRAVEVFFSGRIDVTICVLPDNLDPDDLLRQPNGVERFYAAIAESVDAIDFKLSRFRQQLNAANGLSGRQRCLEDFGRDLGSLGFASMPGVRQSLVINRIADLLGLTALDVQRLIPKQNQRQAATTVTNINAAANTSGAKLEVADREEQLVTNASPLRRRAECDLLCLLIVQPELADTPLTTEPGEPRIIEAITEDDFVDREARLIAETILSRLASGQSCAMQQLMSELQEPSATSLVTELYFEGEQRIAATLEPVHELVIDAYAALRRLIENEMYQQSLTEWRQQSQTAAPSAESVAELIRGRSRQGDHLGALPRVR